MKKTFVIVNGKKIPMEDVEIVEEHEYITIEEFVSKFLPEKYKNKAWWLPTKDTLIFMGEAITSQALRNFYSYFDPHVYCFGQFDEVRNDKDGIDFGDCLYMVDAYIQGE